MLKLVSAVATLATVYLCERPGTIAKVGLELQLKRYVLLAWLARNAYCSASSVYELLHKKPPNSAADEIARFAWLTDRDAELVARVQAALEELTALQTTEVPLRTSDLAATAASVDSDEYELMFREMRESYPQFTNWHDLGFQGQNPATDFRGAGKLGVIFFHKFCTQNPEKLQQVITESRTAVKESADIPWYPVALVSIRLTNAICELLKRERVLVIRLLQVQHHHNAEEEQRAWLDIVQSVHDDMLAELHDLWLKAEASGEVKTYFDTETVLRRFEENMPLRIYNSS